MLCTCEDLLVCLYWWIVEKERGCLVKWEPGSESIQWWSHWGSVADWLLNVGSNKLLLLKLHNQQWWGLCTFKCFSLRAWPSSDAGPHPFINNRSTTALSNTTAGDHYQQSLIITISRNYKYSKFYCYLHVHFYSIQFKGVFYHR